MLWMDDVKKQLWMDDVKKSLHGRALEDLLKYCWLVFVVKGQFTRNREYKITDLELVTPVNP